MERRKQDPARVRQMLDKVFRGDVHATRVLSIANTVAAVMVAASVAIHAIGQALAKVTGITPKSGIKQVNRLLSNTGFTMDAFFRLWVRFLVGVRQQIVVALDWTEFDADTHSVLCAYLVTRHGRATPLVWKTHDKSTLKNNQKQLEQDLIASLHEMLDPSIGITLLADRGFGDKGFYEFLMLLGWDYVVRFRGNILVVSADGQSRPAAAWLGPRARPVKLTRARVTADQFEVPAVVIVWDKKMKEPWCLATSLDGRTASETIKLYGRRFTIEETFRDQKDLHFGMGLKATHIHKPHRRDRLLMLLAIAHALLCLLGAAAEEVGLDRILRANTVKRRTHSLYRQGRYWYDCIPTMRIEWFRPLIEAYDRIIREHQVFTEIFGVI